MPRVKLTQRFVQRLQAPSPNGKQTAYWHTGLAGFGVLVSGISAEKKFVVQHDVGGKSRRITISPTSVLDLDTAIERAKLVLAEFYAGRDPKAKPARAATLEETLADYLATNKSLRPVSQKDYRKYVNTWLKPWLKLPMNEITRQMARDRHDAIEQEISTQGRYTGKAAANMALKTFRTLYNFAKRKDATLPANPIQFERNQWNKIKRRTRLVKADELPVFYQAVLALENTDLRDWILLLLFTGMRRGESSRLKWVDVDFAGRIIRVSAFDTKSDNPLDLPMSSYVYDLLVARRALGNAGGWVFASSIAKSGHVEDASAAFNAIHKATGLPRFSLHDLRRTYLTAAESADISPLALKALVGHGLNNDVTSGYIQMSVERLRGPAQAVCDKLMALCAVVKPKGVNVAPLRG